MTKILLSQLDLAGLGSLVCAAAWGCMRALRKQHAAPLHPAGIAITLAAVVLASGGTALLLAPAGPSAARIVALAFGALLCCAILATWTVASVLTSRIQTTRDIVHRLQRARDISDVNNRAHSEFLAMLSHEIRTPLTAVMGFANVLSETKLDKTQRRYVGTVISASERVVALLNDVLDFSRLKEGRLGLQRLPFAPALLIHEVVELLHPKAAEKGLLLRFHNQLGTPLTVEGDPARLRQVLLNLISNAIKFTDRGSVTIEATWMPPAPGAASGVLTIGVADTGIGIPAPKLRTIFRMFSQVDPAATHRFGGSGLGLSICHQLAELMGGRIHAESTLGEGSTFTFSVPCPAVHSGSNPPQAGSGTGRTDSTPPVLGRVLLVDDQELSRQLMRMLVRRLGYEADTASSGAEAVRLAAAGDYKAIFMDLEMEGMDGYDATRQIRSAKASGRRVPVVAITAQIAPGTREKCLAAGMDDYLTKPVYLPALRAALADGEPDAPGSS